MVSVYRAGIKLKESVSLFRLESDQLFSICYVTVYYSQDLTSKSQPPPGGWRGGGGERWPSIYAHLATGRFAPRTLLAPGSRPLVIPIRTSHKSLFMTQFARSPRGIPSRCFTRLANPRRCCPRTLFSAIHPPLSGLRLLINFIHRAGVSPAMTDVYRRPRSSAISPSTYT